MANERRTVVITGGTKGIGAAAAAHLATLGYDLALSYSSDETAAEETRTAVRAAGGDCVIIKGTFFALQQAARSVIDGGRVIATASTIASYPPRGSGVYAATKAAVRLMVEVLSLELGPRGITVNSLDPGPIDGAGIFTHMTDDERQTFLKQAPMGRLPEPDDLMGALAFLLSDGAAMVSGHHLAVTGGFRI
jgi:NAD(P)-dependent dehydrogenase (short-subunit alcohol dehydrogenase family)